MLTVLFGLFPYPNVYFYPVPKTDGLSMPVQVLLPSPPPLPVNTNKMGLPELTAKGILVLDGLSGMPLFEKNADQRFPPASTTKIMTALVALDQYHLDDILTVNTVITEGKTMDLVKGEQLSAEAFLYGALVDSGNDAAYALAENYPGGVEKFVSLMNAKAKQLHLDNTHYANPIGFDDDAQYTTAHDLAKLARVAVSNRTFAKIVSTRDITVSDISYSRFHMLKNVNELLGKIPGISGVKTGYTENGGEILVSEVKKNNREIFLVVLKSNDRFGETTKLIDWVFSNFVWRDIGDISPEDH